MTRAKTPKEDEEEGGGTRAEARGRERRDRWIRAEGCSFLYACLCTLSVTSTSDSSQQYPHTPRITWPPPRFED